MWPCHSSHQQLEFISWSLESGLDHAMCFGQWGKNHANRGLKTTFGLGLALMLQEVLLSHKETWTTLMEDESPWDRDGLSQLRPHKPTSLQVTHRLTVAISGTPHWDQQKNHPAELKLLNPPNQCHSEWWTNKMVLCFMPLSFGVVCYTGIGNWYLINWRYFPQMIPELMI